MSFMTTVKRTAVAMALSMAAMAATAPAEAEEITVTHWGVLMYGAPYAVAMEKGYYKEQGLDITGVLTSKGGGTTMRNVMAAPMPYGEVALSAAVAAINQGLDVKIIHTGVRTAGEILWVTKPDSPIKGPKDLAGKKVAFTSPKSVTDMLLTMVRDKHGIKVDGIAGGGVGGGLTMLEQGAVVAAPVMDPIWARVQDKYRVVFSVETELPNMVQTVGVTTSEYASKNKDKLKKLIEARRKGVDFVYANPEETAKIMTKYYEIDEQIALRALKNLAAIKYWSAGEFEYDGMDNLMEGLKIIGEIDGKVDWSKHVDASFLK
jgi:NitT/TauT family transport system substrate-binding protein